MLALERTPSDQERGSSARGIIEQIEARTLEPTATAVETAVAIIQRHLDREARNREVSMLAPEDLCPAQKRDMIRDLARLFRG